MHTNKNISFLGWGDLSYQFLNFLNINEKNIIKFDDNINLNDLNHYSFNSYSEYYSDFDWVIGIGYLHLKKKVKIIKEIINNYGSFKNIIHPSSYISPLSNIKKGVVIYPMCNIDKEVTIYPGVLINNSVTISHNSTIGIGSYISPGVTISGNVEIGEGCFLGTGTIISNGIKIGDNVVVGAGSLITKNIPNNSNVIGNPMKVLSNKLKLI